MAQLIKWKILPEKEKAPLTVPITHNFGSMHIY